MVEASHSLRSDLFQVVHRDGSNVAHRYFTMEEDEGNVTVTVEGAGVYMPGEITHLKLAGQTLRITE